MYRMRGESPMRLAELHIPTQPMEMEQPATTHPAHVGDRWNDVRIKTWCGAFHERINVAMFAPRELLAKGSIELVDPVNTLTGEQPIDRPYCAKCKQGHVDHVLVKDSVQPEEDIPF